MGGVHATDGAGWLAGWRQPGCSIFFGAIFALSAAELVFTIDAFVYLEKQHKWWSLTEKARMAFLIFSCARTLFLSALYAVAHCRRVKNLLNTMHTVSRSVAFELQSLAGKGWGVWV